MDQARKRELAELLGRLAAAGAAVLVATHDIEFAARASRRCVLLGRGQRGGRRSDARGAVGRAVLRDRGLARARPATGCRAPGGGRVMLAKGSSSRRARWCRRELAGWQHSARVARRRGGHPLVREPASVSEAGRPGCSSRSSRGRGARAVRGCAQRAGHHRCCAAVGLCPRARTRVHGRCARRARLEPVPRTGTMDSLADGRVGRGRPRRCAARIGCGPAARPLAAGRQLRRGGVRLRRVDGPVRLDQLRGGDLGRRLHRHRDAVPAHSTSRTRSGTSRSAPPSVPRSCVCWSASGDDCTCGGRPSMPSPSRAWRRSRPCSRWRSC